MLAARSRKAQNSRVTHQRSLIEPFQTELGNALPSSRISQGEVLRGSLSALVTEGILEAKSHPFK